MKGILRVFKLSRHPSFKNVITRFVNDTSPLTELSTIYYEFWILRPFLMCNCIINNNAVVVVVVVLFFSLVVKHELSQ